MHGEKVRVEVKLMVSAPKAPAVDPAWKTKAAAPKPAPSHAPSSGAYTDSETFFAFFIVVMLVVFLLTGAVMIGSAFARSTAASPSPTVQITNAPIICYTPGCETQTMPSTLDQNYGKGQGVFTAANINAEQIWKINVTEPGHLLVSYGASYVQANPSPTFAPSSAARTSEPLVGVGNAFTLQVLDDHYRLITRLSDPQSLYQFVAINLSWNSSTTYYLTIQLDPTRVHYINDPNSTVELQYFIQLTP
jgi:hypothetical protein